MEMEVEMDFSMLMDIDIDTPEWNLQSPETEVNRADIYNPSWN